MPDRTSNADARQADSLPEHRRHYTAKKAKVNPISTDWARVRDILTASMNKALLRILLPVLLLAALLAFALALSPVTTSSAGPALNPPPHAQAPTPTPTPSDQSQPGTTGGLVIMSLAIVAIVLLPVLIQRGFWTR